MTRSRPTSAATRPLPAWFGEALARRKARWERYRDLDYARLTEDFRGRAKGTVWMAGRSVPGFPHIGRIVRLEAGLRQQFPGPFWAEEKVDGYNVRVLRQGDRALALTRGGYVCPFTTDRLPDLLDLGVLEREPDLILCAEVAGPDNPYLIGAPPFVADDVRAFVFDLIRGETAGFVPQGEKMRLAERHGLPLAPVHGRFRAEDWGAVRDLCARLDAEGREGLVLKGEGPEGRRTKYVTRSSAIYDIAVRASDLVELPGDFFTGRVLRLALFMDEAGMTRDDELHRRLGRAFLDGLFESLASFRAHGAVYHRFRCRFRERDSAVAFVAHLGGILGHTHLWQRRLEREGDFWLLEFDKEVPKLGGLLHQLFRGDALVD
jgi:putative ATP-dependent DNA ligase